MITTAIKQFTTDEQRTYFGISEGDHSGPLNSKVILDMAKRYTGFSCLEVGAGTGHFLSLFKIKYPGRDIVGIDVAPHSPLVIEGDCTALDFPEKTFDTVFCHDVIEHLADRDLKKCILEIHRVLNDGGYGVFTTKNDEDLRQKIIGCPVCGCSFHCNGHCQSFTKESITRIFRMASFHIAKIRTLNIGYISSIGWLARIFYFLHLQKIFKYKLFVGDLFFIVRKEPYWRETRNSKWW